MKNDADWGDRSLSLLLLLTGAGLCALLGLVALRNGASPAAILATTGIVFGPLTLIGGLLIGPGLMLIGLVGLARSQRGPSRPQR